MKVRINAVKVTLIDSVFSILDQNKKEEKYA